MTFDVDELTRALDEHRAKQQFAVACLYPTAAVELGVQKQVQQLRQVCAWEAIHYRYPLKTWRPR